MGKSKDMTKGRHVVATALKSQGIEYVFGIVGYPIVELGFALQNEGIKYIGMRNEQAAAYAAAAVGYLTGTPGCCLVVPGPGVIHALAGMANASANGWPMICVAGSSELEQDGLGAFQESLPPQGGAQIQRQYAETVCKYTAKATIVERIPFFIEQAVRYAKNGRPGATYVEVAGDTLRLEVPEADVYYPPKCIDPPMSLAPQSEISRALAVLRDSKRPLMIVGKGAAYSGSSGLIREFQKKTGIPFLPSPMGKGVLPDDHPLCMASARSYALKHADAVLLIGARLNWILHYGRPPRYDRGVKFIQIEILPEEIGHSVPVEVGLVGHAKAIVSQLLSQLETEPFSVASNSEWLKSLKETQKASMDLFSQLVSDRSAPLNYYCPLSIVNNNTPKGTIIVNEGSDTMDIGRTVLMNYEPKTRLDAGTWGTMGVGMGQAIAAALVNPNPGCVFVAGDSAFGFSGMEFEVVCRYQLPVIVVILNNNGIAPLNPDDFMDLSGTEERLTYPAKSLTPSCRYEGFATAMGATGVYVDNADDLEMAFKKAVSTVPFKPTIINCMISTTTSRGKAAAPPFAKVGKL